MNAVDSDSSRFQITVEEKIDDNELIDNLARNIGTVRCLDGNRYAIGLNVRLLSALVEFMRKVIETEKLPYRIQYQSIGRVRVSVDSRFKCEMKLLRAFRELAFDGLALSPELDLFHRIYEKHPISHQHFQLEIMSDHEIANLCNDFVVNLRTEGKRIDIKRKIKNWQRNADENGKRLTHYLDALHECYARLMVIRLDLMYCKAACQDAGHAKQLHEWLNARNAKERKALISDEVVDSEDEFQRVDIFTVTEDWRHFKDNMRGKRSLFQHLVGYVCAIEFSSTGGHHLHVALIFDGSKVKQHEWMGDEIGRYWVEMTGGRGYFYNCNRENYKRVGVGMVDHHDQEKRRNLMVALMYLAKKDQFVRVKASPKSKTFMTGHMPKQPTGRTGRPRSKQMLVSSG